MWNPSTSTNLTKKGQLLMDNPAPVGMHESPGQITCQLCKLTQTCQLVQEFVPQPVLTTVGQEFQRLTLVWVKIKPGNGPQVLVLSIYQVKPCWGCPTFDHRSHFLGHPFRIQPRNRRGPHPLILGPHGHCKTLPMSHGESCVFLPKSS